MPSDILREAWFFLKASAPYLLFGFFIAGLIRAFLSEKYVERHLGKSDWMSVVKAAVFGIPLPLCSCSVVPTAVSLKDKGSSPGASAAFLITTPEIGVDSIALTYGLMNPVMAMARPVASLVTGILAGLGVNRFDRTSVPPVPQKLPCCHAGGGGAGEGRGIRRLLGGLRYAYVDLLGTIAPWLVLGILLAGAVSALIPQDWIRENIGSGMAVKFFMLLAGIPVYVCATSSTPLAAALMAKGMSAGTVLVFLLSGPATNLASLTVLTRIFGKRFIAIYLATIAVVAVGAGIVLDALILSFGWEMTVLRPEMMRMIPGAIQTAAALLLSMLVLSALIRRIR